jgi:ATPase subunit of ABC transporter with duplicated ATPase domains
VSDTVYQSEADTRECSTTLSLGGGADLLENASMILVPGRRYGLIGRNGKGKSTLLKFLASRRVGGLDPSTSVHYVSQAGGTTNDESTCNRVIEIHLLELNDIKHRRRQMMK